MATLPSLPTSLPARADYVGVFTDAKLNQVIERAQQTIESKGDSEGAVLLWNGPDLTLAITKRIGSAVSVEAAADYNFPSHTFEGEFAVVASWK